MSEMNKRIVHTKELASLLFDMVKEYPSEKKRSARKKKILFTNPSARAGYGTRSIFKRSLIGLNSEFSFS